MGDAVVAPRDIAAVADDRFDPAHFGFEDIAASCDEPEAVWRIQ